MKLLMIVDALQASALGETARWLLQVAQSSVRRGDRVHVIALDSPDAPDDETDDPPGALIERPPRAEFEATLGEALAADPDLLHIVSPGPFGARVVEILHDLPVLLDVHDFWPICPNGDLLRRPRCVPCGQHFPYAGCGACAGLSRMRAMEERIELASAASAIVAHSAFARARLNAGLGRRIELIEYGVDTDVFTPDAEPVAQVEPRATPRVLFLGPPGEARGAALILDLVIAVRARVSGTEFVVAGSDPANPEWHDVLRAEAREMGLLDVVKLVPVLPLEDLPGLYRSCDVAMAPLVSHEAGGLAVLEAMACGLPLVASPLGAMQDLIEDGDEGLLVSAADVPGFAAALHGLLSDAPARAELGRAARTRVVQRHALRDSLAKLHRLYERLDEGHRRAA